MLEITCSYVILHLNLKRLGFTGEPVTRRTHQSLVHLNLKRLGFTSEPVTQRTYQSLVNVIHVRT